MAFSPFAGMTRIRFKGWRRGLSAVSAGFPPAPLEVSISVGRSRGVSTRSRAVQWGVEWGQTAGRWKR